MPERIEPGKPMTIETRRGGRKKTKLKYNRYGDDFLIDKIQPDEIGADLVSCRAEKISYCPNTLDDRVE